MSKILIADDEVIFCLQLQECLNTFGHDVTIATSGEDAVNLALLVNPKLILMDICMPGELNGIDAAKIILSKTRIPLVFITGDEKKTWVDQASQYAPAGYLYKPVSEAQLYAVISTTIRKQLYIHEGYQNQAITLMVQKLSAAEFRLSPAQIQVAILIRLGKSTKQIADDLNISFDTVNSHRKAIRKKLLITSLNINLGTYLSSL